MTSTKQQRTNLTANILKFIFVIGTVLLISSCSDNVQDSLIPDGSNISNQINKIIATCADDPQATECLETLAKYCSVSSSDARSSDCDSLRSLVCVSDATLVGCEPVLLASCQADPSAADCADLKAEICTADPTMTGCEAELQAACEADTSPDYCADKKDEICEADANTKGCETEICTADPTMPGCEAELQAACEADTSPDYCADKKDEICEADANTKGCEAELEAKCSGDPKIEGCETYFQEVYCPTSYYTYGCTPPGEPIVNTLLADVSSSSPLSNYLLIPYDSHSTDVSQYSGAGVNMTEATAYGSFKGLEDLNSTDPSTSYSADNFTLATGDDVSNNSKNDIVRLSSGRSSQQVNYYFSHIEGKQFKYFLPSLNRLEVIALNHNGTGVTPIIMTSKGGVEFDPLPTNYVTAFDATKGRTYSGYAALRSVNIREKNGVKTVAKNTNVSKGTFSLTVNAIYGTSRGNDDIFDMKIKLNETLQSVPATAEDSIINDEINRIEIKKYPIYSSGNPNNKVFNDNNNDTSYLLGNDSEKINISFSSDYEQVAGALFLLRNAPVTFATTSFTMVLQVIFASNEYCKSFGDNADPANCPTTISQFGS